MQIVVVPESRSVLWEKKPLGVSEASSSAVLLGSCLCRLGFELFRVLVPHVVLETLNPKPSNPKP